MCIRDSLVAAGISGTTYAIPNNNIIGEYTYLLLDKELIKKYNYSATDITSLADAKDFLNDVKNYESGYDPLAYDSYKDPTLVHYWSLDSETLKNDPNQFSLIGCTYTSNYSYNVDKYTKSKTSMPLKMCIRDRYYFGYERFTPEFFLQIRHDTFLKQENLITIYAALSATERRLKWQWISPKK